MVCGGQWPGGLEAYDEAKHPECNATLLDGAPLKQEPQPLLKWDNLWDIPGQGPTLGGLTNRQGEASRLLFAARPDLRVWCLSLLLSIYQQPSLCQSLKSLAHCFLQGPLDKSMLGVSGAWQSPAACSEE